VSAHPNGITNNMEQNHESRAQTWAKREMSNQLTGDGGRWLILFGLFVSPSLSLSVSAGQS